MLLRAKKTAIYGSRCIKMDTVCICFSFYANLVNEFLTDYKHILVLQFFHSLLLFLFCAVSTFLIMHRSCHLVVFRGLQC